MLLATEFSPSAACGTHCRRARAGDGARRHLLTASTDHHRSERALNELADRLGSGKREAERAGIFQALAPAGRPTPRMGPPTSLRLGRSREASVWYDATPYAHAGSGPAGPPQAAADNRPSLRASRDAGARRPDRTPPPGPPGDAVRARRRGRSIRVRTGAVEPLVAVDGGHPFRRPASSLPRPGAGRRGQGAIRRARRAGEAGALESLQHAGAGLRPLLPQPTGGALWGALAEGDIQVAHMRGSPA
jgi:hypothetical protein